MSNVIRFCSQCGAATELLVPPGDTLPRAVCHCCQHIHYENPRLVVGCVAECNGQILLCRRAIEPRHGFWTLPGGFMENNETTSQGAIRETREEAGATVLIDAPFAMISVAHINQVHLFYRGRLEQAIYKPGEESLEARLFHSDSIPWDQLAFRTVAICLQHYLNDRRNGHFGFHETDLPPL